MPATQATFGDFEGDSGRFPFADRAERLARTTALTFAEAEAVVAVDRVEAFGPREFARATNRSPGTVGNLLRWGRHGVQAVVGRRAGGHGSADVGGALFLVGTITLAAVVGLPPLLTLGGGVGLAVLFVVARSWIVVQDEQVA